MRRFLITFQTKFSRRNDFGGDPVILTTQDRIIIAKSIAGTIIHYDYQLFAAAILPDHVHLIMRIPEQTVPKTLNIIKGRSAYDLNRAREGMIECRPAYLNPTLKGGVQIGAGSARGGIYQTHHIWSKGYNISFLDYPNHFWQAIRYVQNNYKKHEKSWGPIEHEKVDEIFRNVLIEMK